MRILYFHTTQVPPPTNVKTDRFFLLSEKLDGDVIQPVWFRTPEEVESALGPGSYPVYTAGRFRYHFFLSARYSGARQKLGILWFYFSKGFELLRERRPDCIVTYSHMTIAVLAGLMKLLTGPKLIVEIVTSPHLVYLTEHPEPSWGDRLQHFYSDACLHLSMMLATRAHFLFPNQLSPYSLLRKVRNSVFHEFVPISIIERYREDSALYVLLVGMPWYLKGADLLIEAFHKLAHDFPDVKLKLLGYFGEGNETLKKLVNGSPQIELMKARPHPETLRIISGAAVLVLPSRCEGLPRVLIEGMAAGVPLVGSDVAGIPFLIQEGENGFVVPGGNPQLLEARLRELLSDAQLRRRMGENSYQRARKELTEQIYVEQFASMVEAALQGKP